MLLPAPESSTSAAHCMITCKPIWPSLRLRSDWQSAKTDTSTSAALPDSALRPFDVPGAVLSCYGRSAAQMSTSFGHVGLLRSCCSLQIQRSGGSLAARRETASYSSCPPTN